MAEDFPYISFIDDPELFPLPDIVPAGALLPPHHIQPLPVVVFPPVVLPLAAPTPSPEPQPPSPEEIEDDDEPVIKFRLSLALPLIAPHRWALWEIFIWSAPTYLEHYTHILERQPHLCTVIEGCSLDGFHTAVLAHTPRRVHCRPATPDYSPLSAVPSPAADDLLPSLSDHSVEPQASTASSSAHSSGGSLQASTHSSPYSGWPIPASPLWDLPSLMAPSSQSLVDGPH